MSKKQGTFLDQFLDKIILGLGALLGLYLLWAFVISNPYAQKVGSKRLGPSEIDSFNKQQAQSIKEKLEGTASPLPYLENKTGDYKKSISCSIPNMSADIKWPVPRISGNETTPGAGDRMYAIPIIPAPEDVRLASMRGTVKMPTQDVTPDIPYSSVPSKPEDKDIVTLSAHINLQVLFGNFQQSFVGPRLPAKWRDQTYAEPVFARVELQRRLKNEDGSWSEWAVVPHIKIDPYQKLFKDLPNTTEQMSFGNVALFIQQYKNNLITRDILQPDMYQFLNTQIKWLPAQFKLEYQKIEDDTEQQRMRDEREKRIADKNTAKNPNRPTMDNRPQQTRPDSRKNNPGTNFDQMTGMPTENPALIKPVKPVRKPEDVEKDAAKVFLDDKTKLYTLKDLTVWVHDDSAQPGATYQYRVRYGVFNPIAGKSWFARESQQYQNHVVLWSPFVELPDPVSVPKMMHVFPVDVLANTNAVKVELFKYYLGKWQTETFEVYPGQIIGKPMEIKKSANTNIPGTEGMAMMDPMMGGMNMPVETAGQTQTVDFTTTYTMMDVVTISDWSSGIRKRETPEMLYIDNNQQIYSLVAKKQFWPKTLSAEYNKVKQEMLKTTTATLDTMYNEGMPAEMMGPPMFK